MVMKKRKLSKKQAEAPVDKSSPLIDFNEQRNTEKFLEEVKIVTSAAVGVVVVRTREFQRAALCLFNHAIATQGSIFRVWSVTDGWKTLSTEPKRNVVRSSEDSLASLFNQGPEDADVEDDEISLEYTYDLYGKGVTGDRSINISAALAGVFGKVTSDEEEGRVSVNVMFAPDPWLADPGLQEHIRAFTSKSLENDARLFLVCHDSVEVPERLQEDVRVIDFDPPNASELFDIVEEILSTSIQDGTPENDSVEIDVPQAAKERIVQNGLGMSAQEFGTALSIALVRQEGAIRDGDGVDIERLTSDVQNSKIDAVRKSQFLEVLTPIKEEDVGGLDILKSYIRVRKKAFSAEARDFGVAKPRGILLAGVPGGGKSLVAKTIAGMLDIPCIAFDIGKVFGGLVGQSEGQMRVALKQIDALAPVVLLVDEVDKGFAGMSGGNDSGTSSRVLGTFLTWMQERKADVAPIYIVFTANNVDRLPPELIRPGRLDDKFCVSFPNATEREEIFKIHLRKAGHTLPPEEIAPAVKVTDQYVGAEIEAIVKEAVLQAFSADKKRPDGDDLLAACKEVTALAKTFPERIEAMNEWARNNARPASSEQTFSTDDVTTPRPGIKRRPSTILSKTVRKH